MIAKKTNIEVADILREHIPDYLAKYRMPPEHYKVVYDILNCRTATAQRVRPLQRKGGLKHEKRNCCLYHTFIQCLLCPTSLTLSYCATKR